MIYTELTKKAMRIAFDAHKEQTDKTGLPYIYHPIHLAEQMDDEATICVALLHDVVEDCDVSIMDLREYGFTDEILMAIQLLTHNEAVPYMEYVENIKVNPIAKKVKLADLTHNINLTRLSNIDEKDYQRCKKYRAAIELLTEKDDEFSNCESNEQEQYKYYRFSSGRIFRINKKNNLFELLEEDGKWVRSGWAMSRFFDAAYDYVEIDYPKVYK